MSGDMERKVMPAISALVDLLLDLVKQRQITIKGKIYQEDENGNITTSTKVDLTIGL